MPVDTYVWDQSVGNLLQETSSGSGIAIVFTTEPSRRGQMISQHSITGTSYYHADGQHSIRALTNEAGHITDTYTYTLFGTTVAHTGTTPNTFRYLGSRHASYDDILSVYQLTEHFEPSISRSLSPRVKFSKGVAEYAFQFPSWLDWITKLPLPITASIGKDWLWANNCGGYFSYTNFVFNYPTFPGIIWVNEICSDCDYTECPLDPGIFRFEGCKGYYLILPSCKLDPKKRYRERNHCMYEYSEPTADFVDINSITPLAANRKCVAEGIQVARSRSRFFILNLLTPRELQDARQWQIRAYRTTWKVCWLEVNTAPNSDKPPPFWGNSNAMFAEFSRKWQSKFNCCGFRHRTDFQIWLYDSSGNEIDSAHVFDEDYIGPGYINIRHGRI